MTLLGTHTSVRREVSMVKNAEEIPDPFLRRVDDLNCPTPRFCNRRFLVRDTQLRGVEKVGEVAVYGLGPQYGKRRTGFGWDKAMFAPLQGTGRPRQERHPGVQAQDDPA
jgi:hypothetical protein